jgi:uncharacterized damage-inducible protein DinB
MAAAPQTGSSAAPPSPKQTFLDAFIREHATTLKVLRAFPVDQSEFRPHPRSQTARELAWTFVMEQALISAALTDSLKLGGGMPPIPESFPAILDQFDREFHQVVELIRKTPDDQFTGTTVKFFAGPGKMADFPKLDFAWFMLCDQIHHRGQYSVYLRLAGGKVPSIYGPSADEPWR